MGEELIEKILFGVIPSIKGPMKQKKDAESILNLFFICLTVILLVIELTPSEPDFRIKVH